MAACASSSPSATAGGEESSAASAAAGAPTASVPASAPAASAAASAPDAGGEGVASAELTVDSGSRAGDYSATLLNAGCSSDFIGPDTFAVASDQVEATGGFMGPQLTIYEASAAAGGTDNFVFGAPFDNYAETLELVPQTDGRGTGTVTLDDRGSTATITIEGTTSDGIALSATIECHSVTEG